MTETDTIDYLVRITPAEVSLRVVDTPQLLWLLRCACGDKDPEFDEVKHRNAMLRDNISTLLRHARPLWRADRGFSDILLQVSCGPIVVGTRKFQSAHEAAIECEKTMIHAIAQSIAEDRIEKMARFSSDPNGAPPTIDVAGATGVLHIEVSELGLPNFSPLESAIADENYNLNAIRAEIRSQFDAMLDGKHWSFLTAQIKDERRLLLEAVVPLEEEEDEEDDETPGSHDGIPLNINPTLATLLGWGVPYDKLQVCVQIINRTDISADSKFEQLASIDNCFVTKKAPEIGDLLGVSGAAIRLGDFWKALQKRRRKEGL